MYINVTWPNLLISTQPDAEVSLGSFGKSNALATVTRSNVKAASF